MIKSILIDHMGTLVKNESEYIDELLCQCIENSDLTDKKEAMTAFMNKHDELIMLYNDDNYKKEYDIALEVFEWEKDMYHLKGSASDYCNQLVEHWKYAPAFDDTYDFFQDVSLPVYILSNNDTCYIEESMKYHGFHPRGIISSEMTRCHKPAMNMFLQALDIVGLPADEILYVGDSYTKDIETAQKLGMKTLLIGDYHDGIQTIETLRDVKMYLER